MKCGINKVLCRGFIQSEKEDANSCYGTIVESGLQLQEQLVKDHLPLYVTH